VTVLTPVLTAYASGCEPFEDSRRTIRGRLPDADAFANALRWEAVADGQPSVTLKITGDPGYLAAARLCAILTARHGR
jgi:hypothetical protein